MGSLLQAWVIKPLEQIAPHTHRLPGRIAPLTYRLPEAFCLMAAARPLQRASHRFSDGGFLRLGGCHAVCPVSRPQGFLNRRSPHDRYHR
jgi:hypothetical protein